MGIAVLPVVLAAMRAAAEALMTDTCTIEVQASAAGDMGEPLFDQYTTVASGVICRLITVGSTLGRALTAGEREIMVEDYRLVCPYATALAVDQRVTLASDSSAWQVIGLVTERTSSTDAQAIVRRLT